MATEFKGVFPVNEMDFTIDKASETARSSTPSYVTIADMESASVAIDTGVETWNPLEAKGWQRALATAKNLTISMSGKRNFGDTGNDYVASKAFKNGQACNSTYKIKFPNGDTLEVPCVIQVKSLAGADSTNVAPLEFDLISDGKPTYTASASTSSTDGSGTVDSETGSN
nr:MAG TPA: major tail protein [Caudoviricetes sp.]